VTPIPNKCIIVSTRLSSKRKKEKNRETDENNPVTRSPTTMIRVCKITYDGKRIKGNDSYIHKSTNKGNKPNIRKLKKGLIYMYSLRYSLTHRL
jgi:phage terminase large subunit